MEMRGVLLLIGWGLAHGLSAQTGLLPGEDVDPFAPRKKATAFGIHVHSNGVGLDVQHWRQLKGPYELAFAWDLASLKHPNETRIQSEFGEDGRPFIYGKQNYAYVMGLTAGLQRVISPLRSYSRLSVRLGIALGPILAFEKPYYIEYLDLNSTTRDPTVIEQFDITRHLRQYIVGQADFFRGFDKINVAAGFRFKLFATLNLAGSTAYVRALQVGVRTDLYGRPVEIMDGTPNKQTFIGGFLGFMIGNASDGRK